jgi:hypothetical protein
MAMLVTMLISAWLFNMQPNLQLMLGIITASASLNLYYMNPRYGSSPRLRPTKFARFRTPNAPEKALSYAETPSEPSQPAARLHRSLLGLKQTRPSHAVGLGGTRGRDLLPEREATAASRQLEKATSVSLEIPEEKATKNADD